METKPKRNTEEDVPLRIYRTTIDRINQHIDKTKMQVKGKKKKIIVKKTTFNDFLVMCLDAYEMFKHSQVYYVNEVFTDLAEARGEAIVKAAKTKTQVKLPLKMCIVGKDEL